MINVSTQKRQGKSLAHIVKTYEALKTCEKVYLVTGAINAYCDLFKRTTGEKLFFKELKRGQYWISLNIL